MNGGKCLAVFATALLWAGPSAAANGIYSVEVEGNVAAADISIGAASATLTIRFENVVGLTADNLGLSATLVDPLSPGFVGRLPSGVSLPGALPLVVKISPPATGGLSFSGVVAVELYTHDLQYTVGSPLRLFSSPDGGSFTDVTTLVGSGSIRTGSSKPDFSEFIIAADVRPLASVIQSKYSKLASLLNQHAATMGSSLFGELSSLYNASQNAYAGGNLVAAIEYLEAFSDRVLAASGEGLPNVWRSSRDLTNVAGSLRSAAATLRYSLTLASNA
ncbi:MAG TPA: DUF6689 family protein [Steroidobacteraceae bacterium]